MKIYKNYIVKFVCLFVIGFCAYIPAKASDTLHKPVASIIKNTKLADGQKRLANAFKTVDTTRIIKRTATFTNKNSAKSAQDPNALSFGNFKVSAQLYGSYAPYIVEYVKNYNNNFGARMGRIKATNKGYFTMIDNTMRKNSIPKEMHSLAVIESGLNPNAVSPVGAMGPWQFMPATGQMLGLQVTELQDDRRDFYKSTQAAAKYTKRLYNMFHDWLLVIAAYNCGPAPILRNLSKTGGRSFWDIKQFLPKETQNHVMAFIATSIYYDKNSKVLDLGNLPRDAKNITTKDMGTSLTKVKSKSKENNSKTDAIKTTASDNTTNDDDNDLAIDTDDESNAQQILPEEVAQVITLKIKGGYNIETISSFLDYDLNKLRRWNPKFNEQTAVLGSQVKLTIPASKLDIFLIQKEKILQASLKNKITISGTTVYLQKLMPAKPVIIKAENKPQNITINNAKVTTKTDSKTAVLTDYQLPIKNNLPNHLLPETSKKSSSEKTNNDKKQAKNYVVKNGDKLTMIAEQFGMTVARLMELNHLKKEVIQVGHTLILE